MTTPAGWQPDPTGQYEVRWWDGAQWTDQVGSGGQVFSAPIGAAPAGQPAQAQPVQPQPVPQQAPAPQAPVAPVAPVAPQVPSDPFAGISGELVDGRFSENEDEAIAKQNQKMLRVRVGEPFLARQGSMVAYQGNVDFAFEGGGAARFLKKALTGEGLPLMRVAGQGDVFLADLAKDVHLLKLENTALSISGKHVLAFSAGLQWNIERVKGAGMITGGLFNTLLQGTGWVAVTTDGPPVVLNAAEAPTYADTDAVIAWSAHLQTQLVSSMKAGALIGRGSGEAVQVAFSGPGFVIVQPSEGLQIPVA
ncbi:MAG: AIM24 family protein [Gordonia sp. (in: high G+C Gram-positive bacteria)]|uniref:AIM24 family protein n=1 Tax=Gordonia sp. (in: high G+C Gram-positive bacteria) TaxID=84139 RepID=UPI0039E64B29